MCAFSAFWKTPKKTTAKFTHIHIVFEQKSDHARFPTGMSHITGILYTTTSKKEILCSYVSNPDDSLFLSFKANTHRQI